MIIATRDDLHVGTFTKNGKVGMVLELGDYHRPLVSTDAIFDTEETARSYAAQLIEECKKLYFGK
jgi:hypothetical protein